MPSTATTSLTGVCPDPITKTAGTICFPDVENSAAGPGSIQYLGIREWDHFVGAVNAADKEVLASGSPTTT